MIRDTSSPYTKIASYYDLVYDAFPYEKNSIVIERLLHRYKKSIKKILDIGCGTGSHSIVLCKKGYTITGIDSSDEMINLAKQKISKLKNLNINFYVMDMRKIKLKGKYDAVIVPGAGYCYLLKKQDLLSFFQSVKKNLSEDGILLFEFWHHPTRKSIKELFIGGKYDLHENSVTNKLIIKFNTSIFDKKKHWLNKFYHFYVIDMNDGNLFDSFTESHVFRTYSISQIKQILSANKFIPLGFYAQNLNVNRLKKANPEDFRIFCIATPKKAKDFTT